MKKFIIMVMALALLMPAAALAGPVKGGTVTISQTAEPPGLDPRTNAAAAIDRVTYTNINEGLVKTDKDGKIQPALAESWTVSPDGKVYTFNLRKGVKFHDGSDWNAACAIWNFDQARAKDTTYSHSDYFEGITSTVAKDDHTLVVTLADVDALFLIRMAAGDSIMIPKGYADMKTHPVGTGAFKFSKWVKGDRVELVRNENYWNPALPYLDKVVIKFMGDATAQFAALKAGDIDVIFSIAAPEMAAGLAKDARFKVTSGTSTGEVIMSTNNKAKPFDNKLVRQAMAYAIDRQAVIDLVMFGYGVPIGSHYAPSAPYYVDLTGKFPYNPAKAKELLAEAGYPDGFEATIKLPAIYNYSKRAGEVIADMLGKVGIKLNVEIVEWGQWISRIYKKKEYELTMIGHVEAWDIGIYARPNYYFNYQSEEFNAAFKKALKAPNEEEKAKWFGKCQEIIAEDAVNGFLFSAPALRAMKKDIMGVWINAPAIAQDMTQVWIAK